VPHAILNSEDKAMAEKFSPSEYLVICREKWDKDLFPERLQGAINNFYRFSDNRDSNRRWRPIAVRLDIMCQPSVSVLSCSGLITSSRRGPGRDHA
jgi:hypothetical protein